MPGTILVLNAGSSSLQAGAFDASTREQILTGEINWGGQRPLGDADSASTLNHLLGQLPISPGEISAVGHRVVHGGTRYAESVHIDPAVIQEIERLAELAPLHNPVALAVIRAIARSLPAVPQVAAFDTAFHGTIPANASLYAVPYDWYARWGILDALGFMG